MKLLCIERDRIGLLRVGEIYTAVGPIQPCCSLHWLIEEFPERLVGRRAYWRCYACFSVGRQIAPAYKSFKQRRFVPWKPEELGIDAEQNRRLFLPKLLEQDKFNADRWINEPHK